MQEFSAPRGPNASASPTGHTNSVTALAFTPDSRLLVSGSFDGTVKIWDVASLELVRTIPIVPCGKDPGASPIKAGPIAVTPQNQIVIDTFGIQVMDLDGRIAEHPFRTRGERFRLSPSGYMLTKSSRENGAVHAWDSETWRRVFDLPVHVETLDQAALSDDGRLAAVWAEGRLHCFDFPSLRPIWQRKVAGRQCGTNVGFFRDGQWLYCSNKRDEPEVFHAASGEPVQAWFHTDDEFVLRRRMFFRELAFCREQGYFATLSTCPLTFGDQAICVWKIDDGKLIGLIHEPGLTLQPRMQVFDEHSHLPAAHQDCIRHLAASLDGKFLASGDKRSLIKLWDFRSGELLGKLSKRRISATSVDFIRSGQVLVGCEDGSLHVWEPNVPEPTVSERTDLGEISSVAVTARGDMAVTASGGQATLWDMPDLSQSRVLTGTDAHIDHVAISADDRWLACGGWKMEGHTRMGHVSLWELPSGKLDCILDGWGEVLSGMCCGSWKVQDLAFSVDHHWLAVALPKEIRVWDLASRCLRHRLLASSRINRRTGRRVYDDVTSLAISPNSRILAMGLWNFNILLWDIVKGCRVGGFRVPGDSHRSLYFSPDGDTLAVATSYDDRVFLHRVPDGKQVGALIVQTNTVEHVRYSPNGRQIVTAGRDGSVRFWDAATCKLLSTAFPPATEPIV